MKKKLLAVIPAHNEARFIRTVIEKTGKYVDFVLVIDDGSTDETREIAAASGAQVIRHPVNLGKGAALQTGFRYALENDWQLVLTLDGDGQHDPADIPNLLKSHRRSRAGVVVGCRARSLKNMPVDRFLTNWFTSLLVSFLAGQRVKDSQCGFRLLDRQVLPYLSLSTSHFDAESEILVKASRAGFRIRSAGVCTIYGEEKSKIRPGRDTVRFFRFFFRHLFSNP